MDFKIDDIALHCFAQLFCVGILGIVSDGAAGYRGAFSDY